MNDKKNIILDKAPKDYNYVINKRMICKICEDNNGIYELPCCKERILSDEDDCPKICQECLIKITENDSKCPFCRTKIKVKYDRKRLRKINCNEFWLGFYQISYIMMQILAVGLISYDIHVNKSAKRTINNILVGYHQTQLF